MQTDGFNKSIYHELTTSETNFIVGLSLKVYKFNINYTVWRKLMHFLLQESNCYAINYKQQLLKQPTWALFNRDVHSMNAT